MATGAAIGVAPTLAIEYALGKLLHDTLGALAHVDRAPGSGGISGSIALGSHPNPSDRATG
ncbi:MAG TPA: hypothetical protein VFJ19_17750 [Nocardioidaceae bacterium]|nr:hypothetical protein [Nocardioidaceae bacterium]